jgi:probable F420-dependent oxidoreductase
MRIGISLPVRELRDDLAAIREFAQTADELGFRHLRVPDQVIRAKSGPLHEPLTLLAYLAAITTHIELVPSVVVLPSRQTALVAKQAAEIDFLSGGRLRFGVGVGGGVDEYDALGQDFHTRGQRCDEQLELLRLLWTQPAVDFDGRFDRVQGIGLDPLPLQRPIPIWIGPGAGLAKGASEPIVRRIARHADGWFAIVPIPQVAGFQERIRAHAAAAGRDPDTIGFEGGCAMAGKSAAEWLGRLRDWQAAGASHLCLRTLDGGLGASAQLELMREARSRLDAEGIAL